VESKLTKIAEEESKKKGVEAVEQSLQLKK
jgi:hypothetical protein